MVSKKTLDSQNNPDYMTIWYEDIMIPDVKVYYSAIGINMMFRINWYGIETEGNM